ncbi:MAG: bacterial transcriptional activator domain-containing protein [Betaproteobacteria bacterium]
MSMQLETPMQFADSIDICLQAMELDPLNEILYRRLMSGYLQQGAFARALAMYLRCCEASRKGLSATVSSETHRLYLEALHASGQVIASAGNLPSGSVLERKRFMA